MYTYGRLLEYENANNIFCDSQQVKGMFSVNWIDF